MQLAYSNATSGFNWLITENLLLNNLKAGCSHTLGCWEMGDNKICSHMSTEESVRLLTGATCALDRNT